MAERMADIGKKGFPEMQSEILLTKSKAVAIMSNRIVMGRSIITSLLVEASFLEENIEF